MIRVDVAPRGAGERAIAPRTPPGLVVAAVVAAVIPLGVLAVFFALPVGRILALGLLPDGVPDPAAALEVLTRPRTGRVIALTLGQSAIAALCCLVLGLPGAFALYRLRFPGRRVLRALALVPFVMPTVVVGIAFRALLRDTPLDGTWLSVLMALVFFNVAVVIRTVGGAWEGLDPRMEEAARSLGASPARVFFGITLLRLAPALAASAAVVFLFCATAFGVVLVLGGSRFATVETEIWLLTTQFLDLQAAGVLSIVQLVVVAGLLLVAARARGRRTAQARGRAARRPRPHDLPVLACAAVVGVALSAPLVGLVARSLETDDGLGLGNYLALASTGSRNALVVSPWQALGTSLAVAAAATGIAMAVALCAAILLSRTPRSGLLRGLVELFDSALMLPLGVSAVTLGFGFLIALDRPPLDLRSSILLVPIAQALVAVPLVLRSVLPVMRGVDPRLRESAAALGASPWRVLATVDLALATRPLLAATGLAFAVSLGEFGATSFLSRPDQPTLPVVIYRLAGLPGGDNLGMAFAASVILAAVTVAVVALVERLGARGTGAFA